MFDIFKKPKEYWGRDRKVPMPGEKRESDVHEGSKIDSTHRSVVTDLGQWTNPDTIDLGDDVDTSHLHSGDAPLITDVGKRSKTIGHDVRQGVKRPIRHQVGAGEFGQQPVSTSRVSIEDMPDERDDPESALLRKEDEGYDSFHNDDTVVDELTEDNEGFVVTPESTKKYHDSKGESRGVISGNRSPNIGIKKVSWEEEKKTGHIPFHDAQKPKRKTEHEKRRI